MLNGKYRGTDIGSGTRCGGSPRQLPRRPDHRRRRARGRGLHGAQPGPLHDDGHRVDDGVHRRGTWACSCRARAALAADDSRRATARAPGRAAHRRDGRRRPAAVADPDRARRSRTACAPTRRSAARRTRSSTCSRSPAGSVSSSTLDDFDSLVRDMPVLVDLMPSGRFLMEEFAVRRRHAAGARRDARRPAAPRRAHRHGPARSARTTPAPRCWNREVIRPLDNPVKPAGSGIAVLRGNLAPRGAVIKQSAATPDAA